jgi:hypothetical protein
VLAVKQVLQVQTHYWQREQRGQLQPQELVHFFRLELLARQLVLARQLLLAQQLALAQKLLAQKLALAQER